MNYVFQFGDVWGARYDLLWGAAYTLRISLMAMVFGLCIAVVCALLRMTGSRLLQGVITAYVELIRNTPLLIQLFLVFFGLPELGFRFSSGTAALIALSVNVGAYATEILRAGLEAVPRGQVEAGIALGLRRGQVFRRIELFQAVGIIFPALSAQYVLTLLAASIVSTIAAPELTTIANDLQARTFRSFEIYIAITGMYFVMAIALQMVLSWFELRVFRRHLPREAAV